MKPDYVTVYFLYFPKNYFYLLNTKYGSRQYLHLKLLNLVSFSVHLHPQLERELSQSYKKNDVTINGKITATVKRTDCHVLHVLVHHYIVVLRIELVDITDLLVREKSFIDNYFLLINLSICLAFCVIF